MNLVVVVLVEAEHSERSSYENNTQTSIRTNIGADSVVVLCACAQKQQTEMNAQNVNEAESTSKNGEQMSKEDTEDSTLERPRDDRKSHDEDAQEESPQNTGAAAFPSKVDKRTPETQPEEPAAQNAMKDQDIYEEEPASQPMQYGRSAEGEATLGWLRDRIDFPMTMFGAAYLGYVGGLFDEGFEEGFPAWLWETNEAMLLKYPFIAEIDEEHIIGGAGHLYCIVPVDENATVAINRVQWNEATRTDEVTEVLYRSESGEPVLLFANLDGVAYAGRHPGLYH